MSRLTTDPSDPDLTRGINTDPTPQADAYLVLSADEITKGFVRPLRNSYTHARGCHPCGANTRMSEAIAATYARDPAFYGGTYCVGCQRHLAVAEFVWEGTDEQVGS